MSKQNDKSTDKPVVKNKEVIAEVVGLGHDGEGVGRVEGFTLFIPGALPGEKVRTKVLKVKKQYGYGKLLEVLEPSIDRVEPPCAIYPQCGGCQLQHMSYDGQLRLKRQLVIDNLERIGKLQDVPVHAVLGMDNPWRYRNKAQLPIGEQDGGLVAGFYARGSHRIIDTDECLIQHEANDHAALQVKRIAASLGIKAYNEVTHRGLLRHVVIKHSFATGETMVVLVTRTADVPKLNELLKLVREQVPHVVSICQNINPARTNAIFGYETRVLWGSDTIRDSIGGLEFLISARSFYQVNPVQTQVLYDKVLEFAALTGKETVIDAYCGIGTISLYLAAHAGKVLGVEIVEDAIKDARRNAELNGVDNADFQVGKAEEILPAWKDEGIQPDVIVVDPPRKGCDPALLQTIIDLRPQRVVYVSCNPSTLARDLRTLEDGGFRTVEVQPVDMFPHTGHVESVVSMYHIDK